MYIDIYEPPCTLIFVGHHLFVLIDAEADQLFLTSFDSVLPGNPAVLLTRPPSFHGRFH